LGKLSHRRLALGEWIVAIDIDYTKARETLEQHFSWAEQAYLKRQPPAIEQSVQVSADAVFKSQTQSYREALLGCAIARCLNPEIDISLPYVEHGEKAFNGRTLDENVVNPFLIAHDIECTRGPYLAVFRRKVRFVRETRAGLKDKQGYDAFLQYHDALKSADGDKLVNLLRYLLYRFVELREQSQVQVLRVERASLQQIRRLLDGLLSRPSGGRMPVLVVVALLKSLADTYSLGWRVEYQEINVSDRARGVGGDVTVYEGERIRLAIEVTERLVDDKRVEAVFQSKISPLGLREYLFAFTSKQPHPGAERLAHTLFTQGHEIAFVKVTEWLYFNLATAGTQSRDNFLSYLTGLLEKSPAILKSAWNEQLQRLLQSS